MKTNPFAFKRARAMMATIQAIAYNNTPLIAQALISQIGPYKSRGHGRGIVSGSRVKIYKKMLRHHNLPAFQGRRECERRTTQILAGLATQCAVGDKS